MTVARLLTFTAASALLVVVPGPSVLFIVGRAVAMGRAVAALTAVGTATGGMVLAALVALGLGPLLARSEELLLTVKLVGAAYLVVLGVRTLLSAGRHGGLASKTVRGEAPPWHRVLREGLVVGVLNPKALVFFSAALPQFVDPAAGSVPAQLAVLGAVFVVTALLLDTAWALFAGSARAWFVTDPRRMVRTTRAGGLVMAGLGAGLAVETVRR